MSNIGNIFGNEGWIQSSIDRSRGKTRPGERRKKAAKSDLARRRQTLMDDPLFQKYGTDKDLEEMFGGSQPKGLKGILAAAAKRQQTPKGLTKPEPKYYPRGST